MTPHENSLFAISLITRSTGTLVKRLVTSKLTNFASLVGLSSFILHSSSKLLSRSKLIFWNLVGSLTIEYKFLM